MSLNNNIAGNGEHLNANRHAMSSESENDGEGLPLNNCPVNHEPEVVGLLTSSHQERTSEPVPDENLTIIYHTVSSDDEPEAGGSTQSQATSSQESHLPNPTTQTDIPKKLKRISGSPRKYHQGLKQTGLLQTSPRSYSLMASPKKKQNSQSPTGSASSSPIKAGYSPSPQKNSFRHIQGTYLQNLLIVIDTVLSEPQDVNLLSEKDLEVISTLRQLSLQAQKLYVRLLQRKLDLKRVSKIVYEDICDQEDTITYVKELVEAGFLSKGEDLGGLPEFLEVMPNPELQTLCKDLKISTKGTKDDRVKAVLKFSRQQPSIKTAFFQGSGTPSVSPLLEKVKRMLGPCCKVERSVHRVFMRLLMLYGLPSYEDMEEGGPQATLTALLLVNLGKMKFPHYQTLRDQAIFRSQEDLIRFEECCQINTDLHKCMEEKKWPEALEHCAAARSMYQDLLQDHKLIKHDQSLPRYLRRFTSLSLLVYMLSVSVECHQKVRQYQAAVDQLEELLGQTLHLQNHRGTWYTRLALNLDTHLKKPVLALEAIARGLKDPELQAAHHLALTIRARRMMRHKTLAPQIAEMSLEEPPEVPKIIIQGRSLHGDVPGYKRAFIRQDSDRHAGEGSITLCSVEELVLGHYTDEGYPEGLHREGTTVLSLFGLYFWDVLYTPLPDVFRSPHQASPLDLVDVQFYEARKELIDKRLDEMRNWSEEEADSELERVWTEHFEEVCLVAWNLFSSPSYAKGLVKSLGLGVLAAICERLAKNYRHTRSGFPDLIVWNPNTKKSRIVEVKGPNDILSMKQIVWLEYLVSCGAAAEVCHVEAIGAKKMGRATPRKVPPKKHSPKKVPNKRKSSDGDDDDDFVLPKQSKKLQKESDTIDRRSLRRKRAKKY